MVVIAYPQWGEIISDTVSTVTGHSNPRLFNPKLQLQSSQTQTFQPWSLQPQTPMRLKSLHNFYLSNLSLPFQLMLSWKSAEKVIKICLSKNHAKHCFNYEQILVDVLWCQPIKLIQVVSTLEYYVYWWNDIDFKFLVPANWCRASEVRT